MRRRAAEAAAAAAIALLLTAIVAWPVLLAPASRIFGMPAAGLHHDPYTFMRHIDGPAGAGVYAQPATDLPGAMAARAAGPVAAYNWIVLVTFPLSAAAAYLLARHLAIAPAWALFAALAFAFSPFHLAQAAYHPHIAQTQWVPLYFLALWRCLDRPGAGTIALLAGAAAGVTLSNFYGGLIAAVMTLPALGAYWVFIARRQPAAVARLAKTAGALGLMAAAGLAFAWRAAADVAANPAAYAAPADDLVRYGARWWSYAVPPIGHPIAGPLVARVWNAAGVDVGVLEQQVALGWGVMALAAVAIGGWIVRDRMAAMPRVPMLAITGAVAAVCSLTAGIPSLLYALAPMFRAYARFGVVVQLMAVLLAAIGAQRLWGSGLRHMRAASVALLALTAAEYAVWPPAMSRDALPSRAHEWVAAQPAAMRVLDCAPDTSDTVATAWLTRYRFAHMGTPFDGCAEPDVAGRLAAAGFTHLVVRGADGILPFEGRRAPDGLQAAAQFAGSRVYAVAVPAPAVYTVSMAAFHPREHDAASTWRWMEHEASWTVANRGASPVTADLEIEIAAFGGARELTVLLDGAEAQTLMVDERRSTHHLGPFLLGPGAHALVFRPGPPPAVRAGAGRDADTRPLSFRVGTWRWILDGENR